MVSSITSWKCPLANSSKEDTALGCLNKLLGVNTIKGFLKSRFIWRRNKWKKLAGVVQSATIILSLPHNCKYRSILAEECSEPCPSYPWGSSTTIPFCVFHLSSAADRYWSKIIWAPLLKSPNWASQMVNVLGFAMAYP